MQAKKKKGEKGDYMNYGHGVYCGCVCQPMMTELEIFKMENDCLVDELVELREQKEALGRKEKAVRNKLLTAMREHHIESFETDSARVSLVEDADYKRVDSEKLKQRYPSAYHACCCYSYKDAYLVLRVKK